MANSIFVLLSLSAFFSCFSPQGWVYPTTHGCPTLFRLPGMWLPCRSTDFKENSPWKLLIPANRLSLSVLLCSVSKGEKLRGPAWTPYPLLGNRLCCGQRQIKGHTLILNIFTLVLPFIQSLAYAGWRGRGGGGNGGLDWRFPSHILSQTGTLSSSCVS